MRQLIQDLRTGKVEVAEVPDPAPQRGQVLVRTRWSLISPGTEQAVADTAAKGLIGKARARPDEARKVIDKALSEGVAATAAAVRARLDDVLTPGYSSSGVVEAVGEGVEGVRVGDRVGCVGANAACHAERVAVPAPLCLPLPDALEDRWGAFGALGGIAAHGVRVAHVEAGAVVLVIGLGLVGQLTGQLASAAGARTIGVDLLPERVELARRLGAIGGGVLGIDDVEQMVRELSQGVGADAVLVTAATKDSGPIELAAAVARDRATIAAVGDVRLDVPRAPFYAKELELRVSRSYGPGRYDPEYEREGRDYPVGYVRWTERRLIAYFFEEVAAGRVRLEDLVTHVFPIEQAEAAYEALTESSRLGMLLRYDDSARPATRRAKLAPAPAPGSGRLGVGLIGPGLFARSTLLPQLRRLDVELVGLAGTTSARALGVGRRWGAGYAATDPEEILGDDATDAVVIATRHDSHAELAARAMERGKSVLVEKPLAIDEAGLRRLEPLLEAGGRLVVDFNRDFAPATRQLADHLGGRQEPLFLSYRVNAGYLEADHWLRDPERGGGRLVGEACHFVELCSTLVGAPLHSVQVASLGSASRTLQGDNFTITLRYQDGSLATVAYISTGKTGMSKERLEVIGSGRSAVLDDFRALKLHGVRGSRLRQPPLRQDKGHAAILAAALEFFRSGGSPPIPYERLIETTRATLLARDALASGQEGPVALPPV